MTRAVEQSNRTLYGGEWLRTSERRLDPRRGAPAYAEQERLGKGSDHWWRTMQERFLGGARAKLRPAELEEAERAGRDLPFDAVLDELLCAGTE